MADELVLVAGQASVWVQPDGPNTRPLYAGCYEVGDIEQGEGDISPIWCPDPAATNRFLVKGTVRGEPDLPTFSLTLTATTGRAYIEDLSCAADFFLHKVTCGRRDLFTNFERTIVMYNAYRTSLSKSNWAARTPDANDPTEISADFTAQEQIDIFSLNRARQTIGVTGDLRAITFCGSLTCEAACGARAKLCDYGYAVSNSPTASVTLKGEVWHTDDGGDTWTEVADPFAADEDISAVACFPVDSNTTRVIVARGTTDAGNPAEIAYSDDDGATWTLVNVGAVNGQFVNESGGLFVLDFYHIWLVTNDGYIYFSADGGLTWTAQEAGVLAATGWNEIQFISAEYGWAVGDNNEIAYTADGGTNWTAVTGTAGQAADEIDALYVIDENRVWIGYSDGQVWYTLNAGTTWTQRTMPVTMTAIDRIKFVNPLIGFLIGDDSTPVGHLLRTIDGGYTWQEIVLNTNAGLADLFVCDPNHAFVAGPVQGGTGYIGEVFA